MANDKKTAAPPKADPVPGVLGETDGPIGEGIVLDNLGLDPMLVAPSPPPPVAPKAKSTPTPAHHTRCTVVGTDVVSGGRMFSAGTVADFPNSDVASLPDILIPVAE